MGSLPSFETGIRRRVLVHPAFQWKRLAPVLLNGLLLLFCLLVLFPVGAIVLTSLNPPRMALSGGIWPDEWFFGHYLRLLSTDRFLRYILNSAIDSLGGALLSTICGALAGYAFARFRFRGRGVLLVALLAMLMLPNLTNLIPLYKLASDLHLRDTYLIMIAAYGAYNVPFGVWIMKGFFEAIPRELEEAAAVDGATPLQTLWKIIVPMALPGLLAVFLISFVYNWNDFLTGLILLSSTAMKTATVGLYDFQNQLAGNESELLAAACVIIMVPGILLFVVAHRAFLEGMAEGAVKG